MKTINIRLIVIFQVLLFFSACKKKDKASFGSGSANSMPTNITPSSASSWYALFEVGKFIEIGGLTPGTYNISEVYFFKTPQPFPGMDGAMVDSMSLNGNPMQFWPSNDSVYMDTTGLMQGTYHQISYPYTFYVKGKGAIPSFVYTRNGPFPTFTGYSSLPGIISKSAGFTLDLQTMSKADYIEVNIHGGAGATATKDIYPPFPASITFSPADLAQVDTSSSYATIEIILVRSDNLNVNGKPMLFSDGLNVTKHISLK